MAANSFKRPFHGSARDFLNPLNIIGYTVNKFEDTACFSKIRQISTCFNSSAK
jgi:hypothetical protein